MPYIYIVSKCRCIMYILHCNILQHTATHCNTLQHTATHCNTLQYSSSKCLCIMYIFVKYLQKKPNVYVQCTYLTNIYKGNLFIKYLHHRRPVSIKKDISMARETYV